jgi:hypothetical protein
VSDHCYALVDQGNNGDTLWQDGKPTPASVVDWAPIVWTRELVNPNSVIEKNRWADFIQVRGVRWGHDNQRVRFMRTHLPYALSNIGTGYLWFDGKWTAVPWQPPLAKPYSGELDNFLRFKRTNKNVGPSWDPRRAVLENVGRKYREYRTNNSNKLLKAGLVRSSWDAKRTFIPENVIEAIVTENTELRLALASMFLEDSELQSCKTKEDFKYARTQYNRWINKVCGLVKTTYDEEGS